MISILRIISIVWMLLFANLLQAQTCNTAILATTPNTAFTDNGDGTITHTKTGLIWAKCPEGQSGTYCGTGSSAGMSWSSALNAAVNSRLAGYSDWRLPNKNELASLREMRCYSPSINASFFPNTPGNWFWSSSSIASDSSYAWVVYFDGGIVYYVSRTSDDAVRLVRGGQSTFSFLLHVSKAGSGAGTVTSTPSGISCGTACTGSYASGSVLTLAAVAANANFFAGWGGACSGNATTCTVTMDAAKSVTATFSLSGTTYTVTPSAGTGGTISPNTAQTVNYGATKAFTVTPNTGYSIASVTGCSGSLSGNTYTTGAINANCTVTATFSLNTYTVTPSAGTGGAISPNTAQTVNYGATTAFTLTPNTGYSIASVTGCSGSLSGNTYTTGAISANCTVTATFSLNTYTVTPSAGTGGTISPNTAQTVNYGATKAFTVTPNTGYSIASVTGCSGSLSGNTYTTGAISANCTVTATFSLNTYTVTPSAGTGGTISPNTAQTVNYGATKAFTVTQNTGYSIASVTGCSGSLSGNTYTTGAINANCTVTATFSLNTYTVTPSAGTGGAISPNTAQTVNYGATKAFTVTPNTGYSIASVTGCSGSLSGNTYTTGAINANCTVTATFSLNTYTVTPSAGTGGAISPNTAQTVNYGATTAFTLTPNTGYSIASVTGCSGSLSGNTYTTGAISANCTVTATFSLNTYTVTPSAGTGGAISPNTAQTVNYGATTAFTLTPNTGYSIASVTGCSGSLSGNTYTTGAISANCTVTATFSLNTYTVTPSAGTNGTISPNTAQTVNYGATTAFTLTPNTGYSIASVTGCSGSLSGNTYTTGAISANCTVTATFSLNTYTVTPSAGTGGTISPNTAQTVNYGTTKSFTVTPNSGYAHNASVGGTCPQGSWNVDIWTTGAITANCTVKFSFTQVYTVTPSISSGGSLSPNTPQIINTDATAQFTLTPNTGYSLDAAVGGTCPQGSWNGNVWTTGAITSDCSVSFSFPINTYAVTPSIGLNGSLTPNSVQMVNYGATASFTATPDSGYVRDPIITGTCPQGSWNGDIWTTGVITAACTVKFAFLPAYTVTPSAGNGGNISPSTAQIVATGASLSFTATATTGYTANTNVGGTCPQGSWNGNVWTTGAITADCTVSFSFICALDNPALTWTTRGDVPWYAQTSISHDGISAMQSGPITDNQASHLETSVIGPANLTFFWKVSSELNFDYLQFLLDDVAKASISGTIDWQSRTFAIPSGTHILRWTYSKDASDGAGSDAGWVDQVTYDGGIINGTCGTANGQSLNTAPTVNLCNTGIASSVIGTGPWTWSCNGTNGGTNANCSANLATYTVTTSKTGSGSGTISGNGNFSAGTTVTLTATPDANSTFAGWNPSPCAASFTMPSNNLTCTATFNLKTYTITPSAGSNGTISPNTPQIVNAGATAQFTVTPNTGYTASIGGTCGGSLSGSTYTTNQINSNCTVNATFTAVAPACTAAWTAQNTTTTNILSSIIWGSNQFVAVGSNGTVLTSPDGINWTSRSSGTTNVLNSVAWSGTKFVAVSGLLDQAFVYVSSDGINWNEHVVDGVPPLRSVIWNGNLNKLIAVGDQGTVLIIAPDGQSWNKATSPSSNTLNAVTFANTANGPMSVAVGAGSTILTSTDGISWTARNVGVLNVNLRTIIWKGDQFLAAGDSSKVFTSLDGQTWTTKAVTFDFYSVVWNGSKYIAVGSNGIMSSDDGQNWSTMSSQSTVLRSVAWDGTSLIAIGNSGIALRYCYPNQYDVLTSVSYDTLAPNSMPKADVYLTASRSTGLDYMVNAAVWASQGITMEPGGQLNISLNNVLQATLYNTRVSLLIPNLQTGDVISALYSGTDKFRRSTGSITIGNTYALTVATTGSGTGIVTTNQTVTPDILCGAVGADCSQQYAQTTPAAVVTLVATATTGSSFSNWGGACSGTTTTCSVTMNAAKNVTATFTTNSTPTSYTVTPVIGKGGTVTPSTPQTVTANTAKSFTVVPKTGYIKSPKGITGTCPLGHWGGNVWTTGNITANCSVNFDFLCLICMPDRGGWRAVIEH